jgi:hypothetical protein
VQACARIALVAVLGLLAAGPAAGAGRPCGEAVLADWEADGRIDGSYPPRCHREALRALPEDVRAYSTAVEDITRAMHARIGAEARDGGNEGNTALGARPGGGSDGMRRMSAREPQEKEPAETTGGLAGALATGVPTLGESLPLPLVLAAALLLLLGLAGSSRLIARGLR